MRGRIEQEGFVVMTQKLAISVTALAIAAGWAMPAHAQSADSVAIQREIAAMRAQMQQMAQRIDTLESQLDGARAEAQAANQAATAASAQAATTSAALAKAPKSAPVEVTWKGGPEFKGEGGWSFKPRGRLQLDAGGVDAPSGITSQQKLGFGSEFRRAYIGFDGTMPGGFGYRVEADLANSGVDLTDLYLTYKASPEVTLTLGQQKPFWSMEEMTSDLFTSFMERAAFHSAFGYERRVGASATYSGKTFLVQGGVFTDNARDLNTDTNNSYSIDARAVFMPKVAGGQLHIGGSAHYRELNDLANVGTYSARPFVHTTDLRLVNTGNVIPVTAERSYGAELAYVRGPFHATAESQWLTARRPGLADPTFNGGYAEVGYILTGEDTAYKAGAYDRIKPKKPVGKGGMGAVQINARYDWLDLSDAGVVGGRQQIAGLSALWIPTDYVRFILNYGHIWLKDAAVPAGADRDYSADSIGMRAQFDF